MGNSWWIVPYSDYLQSLINKDFYAENFVLYKINDQTLANQYTCSKSTYR